MPWVAALLALYAGCGDGNRPPSLALVTDAQVLVGETLRLSLRADDPDGDRLRFSVIEGPEAIEIAAVARDEALLIWSPSITETAPGGLRHAITVEVQDGRGGSARQRFGVTVFPTFGTPSFQLGAGVVLNLARESRFSFAVEVKDDDSTDVAITMREGPTGARLVQDGRKSAWFSWEPSAAQRDVSVHRAIFLADDGSSRVEHSLTLILLNAEQQAGCTGTPPTIEHAAPGDHFGGGPIPINATAWDQQSQVQTVVLQWTRDDVSRPDLSPSHRPVALQRLSPQGDDWRASVDPGTLAPGGELLHYYLLATDNDDPTGFACDLTSRLPKTGYFTLAAYPPGAPTSACADDSAEPDNTPEQAPTFGTGHISGRRLCPNDRDLLRLDAARGDNSQVTVTWNAAAGGLSLRLIDASGAELASSTSAQPGQRNLSYFHADDRAIYAELTTATPGTRLSYALDLRVDAIPCEDDDAGPDSTPAQARPLPVGDLREQVICPGDSDFFRVDVRAGRTYRVSLLFEHRFGDLDLELLDASGATVLDRANSERSLEEIVRTATSDTSWLIRVYGVGAATNSYYLSFDELSGVTCPRDSFGSNHSFETAAVAFDDIYSNLVVCQGTPDYFILDLNGDETVYLLTLSPGGVDLSLDLFSDPSAAPIATDRVDGSGFTELTETLPRGRYYYRVSTTQPEAAYDILQEVDEPPGPCQPDRLDGGASPPRLDPGIHTRLRLCTASETDSYAVHLDAFERVTAFTAHDAALRSSLTLFGPSGATVATGAAYSEGTYLEQVVEQSGVYRLEVRAGFGTSRLLYGLVLWID